jgi:hypothetical protein
LQRRGIGELDRGKDVTLVFIGRKPAGTSLPKKTGACGDADQEDEADQALADGDPADADVAAGDAAETR